MMSVSCARGSHCWKIGTGNTPYIRIHDAPFVFFLSLLVVIPFFLFPFRVRVRTNTNTIAY